MNITPDKVIQELEFLFEAYKKNKDKSEFVRRLITIFTAGDISARAYQAFKIILGEDTSLLFPSKKKTSRSPRFVSSCESSSEESCSHTTINSSSCSHGSGSSC